MPSDSARSAYIHVPFCRHRCGYCNFSVVADRDDLIDRYLTAIDRELQQIADQNGGPPSVQTLFVGGGTPTHLPGRALDRFLATIRKRFEISDSAEWSMEANPEDIDEHKLAAMRAHGVNRLSLGVQSFDDSKLAMLERGHRGRDASDVIRRAADSFENLSIDLIFAAPGETLANWESDLIQAVSLPIRHVSTYALTFEKGTAFWNRRRRGGLQPAEESEEIAMYDLAREMFSAAGLKHYEISNFAAEGSRCRHNLRYWRGQDWYAAGPGAAAFLDGKRTVNHRSPTTYLKKIEAGESAIAESETVTDEQSAREAAAFGVRMIDGVDLAEIQQRTGIDLERLCDSELDQMESQGLIRRCDRTVRLTDRGIHFADTVAAEFLG